METNQGLIEQAKEGDQHYVWSELVDAYTPLIQRWLDRFSISSSDRQDLVQEVLLTLANQISQFEHNGRVGAFRRWLRLITVNRCRKYFEKKKRGFLTGSDSVYLLLDQLEDPSAEITSQWNEEYLRDVICNLLNRVKSSFSSQVIALFWATQLENKAPQEVAEEFGVSVGQVYKARFRVLSRLKNEVSVLTTNLFAKER